MMVCYLRKVTLKIPWDLPFNQYLEKAYFDLQKVKVQVIRGLLVSTSTNSQSTAYCQVDVDDIYSDVI